MAAGYSQTPLRKKLGIKPGYKVRFVKPPEVYFELLGPLPEDLVVRQRAIKAEELDFIHIFTNQRTHMQRSIAEAKRNLKKSGMIWVSWYKKSSKLPTEISERDIRKAALSQGLVDVKVCAIDENWSGLKLMYRVKDR